MEEGESIDETVSSSADTRARLLRERVAIEPRWLEVSGRSMEPTIVAPARLLVSHADAPRLGEIWVFVDDDDRILAHRFLRRVGELHRFEGDGEAWPDPLVGAGRLVGRATIVADVDGERPVRRRRALALWMSIRHAVERRRVTIWRLIASRFDVER